MDKKDQALLISRLYLPLVVREILEVGDVPADMDYTLHEVLSDYRPDSALLAIAASVREIAGAQAIQTPKLKVLAGACDKIIHDYAPRWMETFADKKASEAFVLDVMDVLAEDLQTISDLLKAVMAATSDEKTQALFQIFQVQSGAQALVAEEFLNVMECEFMHGKTITVPAPAGDLAPADFSDLDMDIARYGSSARVLEFPVQV